jgi:hypothetical protein
MLYLLNSVEYMLERFLPKSLLESTLLKRKDLKRLLNQNLEWFIEKNFLNKNDIKMEYLKCMNELFQYSGRIFFVTLIVNGFFFNLAEIYLCLF